MPEDLKSAETGASRPEEGTFDPWGRLAAIVEECFAVDERRGYEPETPREREMQEELVEILHEARSKARPVTLGRAPLCIQVHRSGRASARAPRRRSVRTAPRKSRAPDDSEPPLADLEPASLRVIGVPEFRRELTRAGL
jgi:hypothetical protein